MSFTARCRMFSLGLFMWLAVTFQMAEQHAFTALGTFHAGLAGLVAASAFMPRTMLHWA